VLTFQEANRQLAAEAAGVVVPRPHYVHGFEPQPGAPVVAYFTEFEPVPGGFVLCFHDWLDGRAHHVDVDSIDRDHDGHVRVEVVDVGWLEHAATAHLEVTLEPITLEIARRLEIDEDAPTEGVLLGVLAKRGGLIE